jgi:hypothetical protein
VNLKPEELREVLLAHDRQWSEAEKERLREGALRRALKRFGRWLRGSREELSAQS